MDKEIADLILEEIVDRNKKVSFDFEKDSFSNQLDFINDPAKLKAAFCTRRAAKSFSGALYLIKEALGTSGVSCLFIALTRASAENILWKDCLKVINRK